MSWRDRLLPSSFRGVRFEYEAVEGTHGRRVAVYEYAGRDVPDTEDFGRKAREFSINAYVIGPNYDIQRELLADALDQAGPGIFVHPKRGEMLVAVINARLTESTREGGMARFTITFVQTSGGATQPSKQVGTSQALASAASNLQAVLTDEFVSDYTTTGLPEWVRDAAGEILLSASFALRVSLPAEFSALTASPQELADYLFEASLEAPALTQPELERAVSFGSDLASVDRKTAARTAQANNQTALTALVRGVALVQAAAKAASRNFDSLQQAYSWRDTLMDAIDRMADDAEGDALYFELAELRARLVADIEARVANLPRIAHIELAQSEPALLTAWRMYGDATRDAEIVKRNNIRLPGFVPAGEPLEVLVDAA